MQQKQLGCKKCGAVVTIELQPWSDRLDLRVKEGTIRDAFGKLQIECKKCRQALAVVTVDQT